MPRVLFNGKVIAESAGYETVEGNVYFPADSIKTEFFKPSDRRTTCAWKGEASCFDVVVNGEEAPNAA